MNLEESANVPFEVRLAWEVMSCRALRSTYESNDHSCRWFNQHYGPYPAYDWIDDLPHPDETNIDKPKCYDGCCVGMRYQVPELMSGCRKAPIMTIGINPNLTAYYPSPDGATWCYPFFDNIEQYAYYFRHRTMFQEQFSVDFMREHAIPGTEVRAAARGKLIKASISSETGGVNLQLEYEGEGQRTLYLEPGYKVFVSSYDKDGFEQGDMIASKVELPERAPAKIYRSAVGYYQRFDSIFSKFKEMAGLDDLPLALGEDVCQADMVACASPGWRKWFTDKARDGIVAECVERRKYLLFQLLQTRPRMVVFSGMNAFEMFYDVMKPYIETDLDLHQDTYVTLKECIQKEIRLFIPDGEGNPLVSSRLAISPHFSYRDNFRPQYRFSKEEWDAYSNDYPEEFKELSKIARSNYDNSCKLIFADDENAPTEDSVIPAVWEVLQAHFYDVEILIAQVINDEYKKGGIAVEGEHLRRSEGRCNFCRNQLFSFKEGCPYDKLGEDTKIVKVAIRQVASEIFLEQ